MKRALLAIMVGVLYLLHQDFWFWRTANPLVFGFMPIGLFYHACYTIAVAVALWILIKQAWPTQLEEGPGERRGDGATGRGGETGETERRVAQSPPLPVAPSEGSGSE